MFTYTVAIETLMGRHLVGPFSLSVNKEDKIALIGEEGNGKSVFLKSLVNEDLLTDLKVTAQISNSNIVFGYLAQEINETDLELSALEYCIENDWDRYPIFLSEFKRMMKSDDFDRALKTYSGGERMKIQLIRLSCIDADCYILDEPSNDLDIETLEILEAWMLKLERPILFVSHDERLIQNVANRIIHFEQVRRKTQPLITVFEGSYDDYRIERSLVINHHNAVVEGQKRMKRKQEERWQELYQNVSRDLQATKGNNPATGRLLKKKMKTVKSMKKRFDREEVGEIRETEESITLRFDEIKDKQSNRMFDYNLDKLTIGTRVLGNNYHLSLGAHDKVACIGRNGIGKTQFMKTLMRDLNIPFGIMHQDYTKNLDFELSALDNLVVERSSDERTKIMLRLGSLKFTGTEMNTQVKHLSGGQKAKISLLKLVLMNPKLILLDEPTRNLSPLSVGEIYSMLQSYNGAIFCITHDRNLIDAVFDEVVEFTENGFIQLK